MIWYGYTLRARKKYINIQSNHLWDKTLITLHYYVHITNKFWNNFCILWIILTNWYYFASNFISQQWVQKYFLIYLWKFKINIWFYYSGSETIWSEVLILIMMNVTNQSKSTSNSIPLIHFWLLILETFNLFDFYVYFLSFIFGIMYTKSIAKKKKAILCWVSSFYSTLAVCDFALSIVSNRKRFSANCTANVLCSFLAVCQTAPVSYSAYYCCTGTSVWSI